MAASPPLMQTKAPAVGKKPQAKAQPAPARTLPYPCLLPAVASGVLLWACYHPLAWAPLAWLALVPLLCLVRSDQRPRNIYFAAWAGGNVFFWVVLQWMRVADGRMYATWAMLAVYCALYFPAAIFLTRLLDCWTRLPLVVTFPAVWVGLEYIRSFLMTGFPWYFLAHSQHEFLSIIQVTDLGGGYAVSLLVAAVNALLFDVLYQFAEARRFFCLQSPSIPPHTIGDDWPGLDGFFFAPWRRTILIDILAVTVLVGAAFFYGQWRLEQPMGPPGPVVALLQGNIDQRLRNQSASAIDAKLMIAGHYTKLCKLAVRCQTQLGQSPDLFIWPETSDPEGWIEISPELPLDQLPEELKDADPMKRSKYKYMLEAWQAHEQRARDRFHDSFLPLRPQRDDGTLRDPVPQLLGVNTHFLGADSRPRQYNSALLLNSKANPDGRFDKMHRVPWGEYVPLRDWLPFLNWFAPYDHDYSIQPGETFTRFKLDDYKFGVLICFEDTDPFLARRYVRDEDDGPPVNFLVNMSNDGWFDGTSEHEEHLAVSRFRAIECRRALVRSVNMGISAVIDGNGRVLHAQRENPGEKLPAWSVVNGVGMAHSDWASFKKVSGVLVAAVPIDDRVSLYARYGDWLPGVCWALIGVAVVAGGIYRRIYPSAEASPQAAAVQ